VVGLANTRLLDLERKLRCSSCGNRQGNTLSVSVAPWNWPPLTGSGSRDQSRAMSAAIWPWLARRELAAAPVTLTTTVIGRC
jgi:hypothetical protein